MMHQCRRCKAFEPDDRLRITEMPVLKDGVPTGERGLYFVHRGDCVPLTPDVRPEED